ncbi:hypothetical protein [Fulvivirga imtechensis]|uniref:hypothetical protein n=1 Tax=Fulvivirga imtechensis TaxID=881893 RepID=UPI00058B4B5F|nr:hypothetical protein [Fulvivirga imtechensis]
MDIKSVDIKAFLDGVDTVLNSNTFLLNTSVCFKSREKAADELFKFITSSNFIVQVLEQDLIRGWRNYQQNEPLVMQYLVKRNFRIKLSELSLEGALKYLKAMLTVEGNPYNFWSLYNTPIEESMANRIVRNFLKKIDPGSTVEVIHSKYRFLLFRG